MNTETITPKKAFKTLRESQRKYLQENIVEYIDFKSEILKTIKENAEKG